MMVNTTKLYTAVVLVGGGIFLFFFMRLYFYNSKPVLSDRHHLSAVHLTHGVADHALNSDSHAENILLHNVPSNVKNTSADKPLSSNSKSHSSSHSPNISYRYKGTVLSSSNHKTELVSAFFDFRQDRRVIAVLGCQDHRISRGMQYYCQVKYSTGLEECISRGATSELLSGADENNSKHCWSHRFTCSLESGGNDLPTAVALSTSSTCDSPRSGWLDIYNTKYNGYVTGSSEIETLTFGVCFQTPFYQAQNWKKEVLVEAIERYRSMGAEWFTVYFRENPSSEIMQVLSEYKMLEAINMTVSDATYYDLRYYGELIAIRDCVYRNMYRVKYLALTDIDEVIVPQIASLKNIPDMLLSLDSSGVGAFQFKHVAFMVDPKREQSSTEYTCTDTGRKILKPRFETNTYRSKPFPVPEAVSIGRWKVIVKPLNVEKIGIHSVYQCMSGYRQITVPETSGLLYHYRENPFFDPANCRGCVTDNRLVKLAPGLIDTYITKACGG